MSNVWHKWPEKRPRNGERVLIAYSEADMGRVYVSAVFDAETSSFKNGVSGTYIISNHIIWTNLNQWKAKEFKGE